MGRVKARNININRRRVAIKMKYQFEVKEEIVDCLDCPCFDALIDENDIWAEHGWECWINKRTLNEVLATKPKWCPLEVVRD